MSDMKMAIQVLMMLPLRSMLKTRPDGEDNFLVYPYVNGREKGFCLINNNKRTLSECKAIVFSENRSSDGMIYIVGKCKDFNIWDNGEDCNCVSEEFWKQNRKIFETDQINQTLKMIRKEFKLDSVYQEFMMEIKSK